MLLDTNIIIYAINTDSPKHALAKQFILENQATLVTAQQNIFETMRVLTHPKYPKPLSPTLAEEIISQLVSKLKLIQPLPETAYLTLEFIKEYQIKGNRIFDAYLAATALTNDVSIIATDNVKDFQQLRITIHNPFLPASS